MSGPSNPPLTRREFVAAGVAGAGFATAAGIGAGALLDPDRAAAAAQSDADVLRAILSIELLAVFCYGQVLSAGKLGPEAESLVRELLGHEQTHVDMMTGALANLGQQPPSPPANVAAADAELGVLHRTGRLGSLHTEQDGLRLLEQVESLAQGAYYTSMSKLTDLSLARTCASILGAEAQHYTALAALVHPGDINKAVPGAFVEGSR